MGICKHDGSPDMTAPFIQGIILGKDNVLLVCGRNLVQNMAQKERSIKGNVLNARGINKNNGVKLILSDAVN